MLIFDSPWSSGKAGKTQGFSRHGAWGKAAITVSSQVVLSLSSWVFSPRKCQCSSFLCSNNRSEVVCMSHSSDLVPCIGFTLSHKNPYTIGFLDLYRFNCSHMMLLLYFSNCWPVYLTLSYQHDVVLSWGTSPSVCELSGTRPSTFRDGTEVGRGGKL